MSNHVVAQLLKTSLSFRNKRMKLETLIGTIVIADPLPEQSVTLGQAVIIVLERQ